VAERTRALNRLHALLRDLLPGGVGGKLSADRAACILRGIRPRCSASDRLRRGLASEILRDVRTLDRKIADLNARIEAEVEASGSTLTEIFGVGPILAATIIGAVGNVARFPSKGHFASYSGTAPALRPQAAMWCATGSLWPATDTSTTLCTWSPPAKLGRTLEVVPTTARR
jgi:transposase